tara:strand:+ start:22 stop:927 length:906 start_codon:yes stop_codon:yes gene_type:complete
MVVVTYTFLAFSLIAFLLASLAFFNHRKMKSNPTILIKDLQEGQITINGTVEARGPLLTSPMAKAQCVFYGLFFDNYWVNGNDSYTETLLKDVSSTSFVVNDGTGVVAIRTGDLVFSLSNDLLQGSTKEEQVALDGDRTTGTPQDVAIEVLQSMGEDVHRCNKAHETYLKNGDELFIKGFAKRYEIHINREGEQYGPYSMARIKDMYAANQLLPTDLAWNPEVDEWELLSAFVASSQEASVTPEWLIVADPNKGTWDPGIHMSTQSKEKLLEKGYRISKYCFGAGFVFAVLFIVCWLFVIN